MSSFHSQSNIRIEFQYPLNGSPESDPTTWSYSMKVTFRHEHHPLGLLRLWNCAAQFQICICRFSKTTISSTKFHNAALDSYQFTEHYKWIHALFKTVDFVKIRTGICYCEICSPASTRVKGKFALSGLEFDDGEAISAHNSSCSLACLILLQNSITICKQITYFLLNPIVPSYMFVELFWIKIA